VWRGAGSGDGGTSLEQLGGETYRAIWKRTGKRHIRRQAITVDSGEGATKRLGGRGLKRSLRSKHTQIVESFEKKSFGFEG